MPRIEPLLESLRSNYPGPCLIFDLAALRDAADALARIGQACGVRFIAAAKALPAPSLLDMAVHAGDGFDVSNVGELRRLRDWSRAGGSTLRIPYVSMSGPALLSGAGADAADRCVDCLSINVETYTQLAALDSLSGWATEVEIGARIGLELPAPASGAPCAMSRFGFSEHDPAGLAAIAAHPRFAVLHCHVEGDSRQPGSHVAAASRLVGLARKLKASLRRINLGGGFRSESVSDIEYMCRQVRAIVPAGVEIIFEPGAWLTARAGYAFCRLLWTRDRPDLKATLAAVDLSRECHLRWTIPQLLRWWGAPPPRETIIVTGPTCYEADHLGTFRCGGSQFAAPAGDAGWLLFGGISGYAAAFNTSFNGIERARVLAIGNAR